MNEYVGQYYIPYFNRYGQLRWEVKSWHYTDNTYLRWYGKILVNILNMKEK